MRKLYLLVMLAIFATGLFISHSYIVTAGENRPAVIDGQTLPGPANCSDGWRITGYFTPVEGDYTSTEMTEINVGRAGKMSFNADFVRVVFDDNKGYGEGWGKTRFGWYLGNYDGRWHRSDVPLGVDNQPLKPNSVAVDPALIPADSTVTIPGLPGEYGKMQFVGNDEGVTVHGKHIDIYTGEGRDARRKMNWVTFEDDDELQRVCFSPPVPNS